MGDTARFGKGLVTAWGVKGRRSNYRVNVFLMLRLLARGVPLCGPVFMRFAGFALAIGHFFQLNGICRTKLNQPV